MNIKHKISFPALVINKSKIDKIKYKYLVCDKRFIEVAFRQVLIIDALGKCFEVERIVQSGGVSIFYSLKLIGIIVKVEPILNKPVYEISLEKLKDILINIIDKSPSNVLALDSPERLRKKLRLCSTILDTINVF